MYSFTCVLNIGKLYPVREANSKQEFIDNLITEYNEQCFGLLDIGVEDITVISSDEPTQDRDNNAPLIDRTKVPALDADGKFIYNEGGTA